jgi:hypothetical protein
MNSSGYVIIGNYTAPTDIRRLCLQATQLNLKKNNQSMSIFLEPYFTG